MNLEQLTKFCGIGNVRACLQKPWIRGKYAVASNGAIAVRVPAKDFISLVDKGTGTEPNIGALIEKAKWLGLPLMPIPELPPPQQCECCAGTGTTHPCSACDGVGTFAHYGQDYDCKECDGYGWHQNGEGNAEPCVLCDGLGEGFGRAVQVGDSHFDRRYLALIASLPNAAIAPNGPEGTTYFSFDGGDGVLMPVRMDGAEK